jgi:hypothetical protein
MARSASHVIETKSRRIVAGLLPPERFLERDQTERDYGIDLTVECFDGAEPSGALLLLQLKGADVAGPPDGASTIRFDLSVKRLLRVERFSTPVLLVWCPVEAPDHCCWFLWLQSYIAVVLDQEKPDWRGQKTIRLHIPIDNRLPDDRRLDRLRHIAGHPGRTAAMGQLARIVHEAPFVLEDPRELRRRFQEALALDAIYGDTKWRWAQEQRRVVECGLRACELAVAGLIPSDEQLREAGWVIARSGSIAVPNGPPRGESLDDRERIQFLRYAAEHCARMLSNTVAVYFDERMRHTLWKSEGDHDF